MKPVKRAFFNKSTLETARDLLGCYLVSKSKDGEIIGKIAETEAYLKDDPAAHSFAGKTKRNEVMFGPSGRAYVYFTYGMHYCFNVVTEKEGKGEAVLIRALEPIEGLELMKKRRKTADKRNLCSGPAKLTQALGITKEHNGIDLMGGELQLCLGEKINRENIIQTTRIGISKGENLPYRFFIKDNPFVSRV